MNLQLTSQKIWDEVEKNTFAVLGMVTAKGEPRTVGIVYVVDDHKLYVAAERTQWKTKHIERNPHVSATVPIPKRVPLMPWIKVPAATITFSGTAQILEKLDLRAELLDKLYRHDEGRGEWCAIEMTPQKDFITYGVGVSLLTMRSPAKSRSRAPVRLDKVHDAHTDTTTADPDRRTDAISRPDTESPVTPLPSAQQANLDLVMRAGTLIHTAFANSDEEVFALDFVFHFVNPNLAELHGDHHGYDGFRSFFERLHQDSDTGFHNEPHSLTPYGDELVVAYATNTVSFGGTEIDVDAIVVWRIVDGRISEAWDIPAINTVRPHQPPAE